jgi:hypothetical protein
MSGISVPTKKIMHTKQLKINTYLTVKRISLENLHFADKREGAIYFGDFGFKQQKSMHGIVIGISTYSVGSST